MAEPAPTRNPATPVSSAPAASQTPASSSPAPSPSSAPASASTSSSAPASSSSAAPPPSSSPEPSSSSIASSMSSSSSASRSVSATIASAEPSTSAASSSGLSPGAIGGIAGGAVGGIILIALLWYLIRRRKDRKHRVPPPPPRDFRDMSFNGSARPRMGSNNMMSQSHRASSFSTLIHPGRPSSQYPSASRSPSYYVTYPVATPSTMPDSPPMPASLTGGESPPAPSSGSHSGLNTPAMKPVLAPIDTALHRDNSSSSGEGPAGVSGAAGGAGRGEFGMLPPKHKSSIDRLRSDEQRAPSRASNSSSGDRDMSSRTTSPHPSMYGPSAFSGAGAAGRHNSLSPDGARYPRPPSMASLSTHSQTGRYLRPQGAPHAGRIVNLEMPKPLGARPDSSGDYFWQTSKIQQSQGFDLGFDGGQQHQRRMSRAATELDFHSMPTYGHARMPSSQSQHQSYSSRTGDKARSPSSTMSPTSAHDRQPAHSRSLNNMRPAPASAAQR